MSPRESGLTEGKISYIFHVLFLVESFGWGVQHNKLTFCPYGNLDPTDSIRVQLHGLERGQIGSSKKERKKERKREREREIEREREGGLLHA
jgi:hypothetical protein